MPLRQETTETPITAHATAVDVLTVDGVPWDVYSFFGASHETLSTPDKDKLKDIYEFFKADNKTRGDIMQDISNLESRLGMAGSVSRVDRVWNWISLGRKIRDLELRKQALERR